MSYEATPKFRTGVQGSSEASRPIVGVLQLADFKQLYHRTGQLKSNLRNKKLKSFFELFKNYNITVYHLGQEDSESLPTKNWQLVPEIKKHLKDPEIYSDAGTTDHTVTKNQEEEEEKEFVWDKEKTTPEDI